VRVLVEQLEVARGAGARREQVDEAT